jgi:hypothetical protein
MGGFENINPVNTGSFPIDTTLQLTGSFIMTLTGQLADPGTITLFLTPPNAAQEEFSYPAMLTRTGIGVYTYNLTPASSGVWVGTWQGGGAVTATRDFLFTVLPSQNIPG